MQLCAAAPTSPGHAAFEKANALFLEKKLPEAMAAIDEALGLDPRLVPALTLKAKIAMATNRHDVARQCLEKAISIEPRAQYANFLYGLEAYLENNLKEALPRFRKARELNPADPRAALYLGLTTESLGQPAEALSLYEEAVRLESAAGGPQAETLLPGVRLLLLMGRLEDCDHWVQRALKLSPKSRDAHFEYARLLLKKGDVSQSAKEGEIALTLSDGVAPDAAIHYLLVQAWQKAGSPDRAALHAAVIRAQEGAASR